VVATILPIHSDLFRIRARSDRTSRSIQRDGFDDLAPAAMSAVLRGWLRSGEVVMESSFAFLCAFASWRENSSRKGAKSQSTAK
jgi:hypothetical protein